MGDKRQKNQLSLACMEEHRGEAPKGLREGTESSTAKCGTERPAINEQLMEEVCGGKTAGRRSHESRPTKGVRGWTESPSMNYRST